MKSGFVNIFGKPNAGKSTLLNALVGEKLAIVSSKVQTTRHRIKAFLTKPGDYQIVFSDTPGILEPKYKLHERMMRNDAMQVGPQTVHVRRPKALDPLRIFTVPVVAAFSLRALITRLGVR